MRNNKLAVIRKTHTKMAEKIAKNLVPEILTSSSRYVVAIAGESRTGKTAIACELSRIFSENNIKSILLQQKDYFKLPPEANYIARRRDTSAIGTSEVKLTLLDRHLKQFKNPKTTKIEKPFINPKENIIKKETLKCKTAKVMIIEGTYTTLLKNSDKKIFLTQTFKEVLQKASPQKKPTLDAVDKKALSIEHQIISKHKKMADIVVEKDFLIIEKKEIKRICMLTVHGYVACVPVMGMKYIVSDFFFFDKFCHVFHKGI